MNDQSWYWTEEWQRGEREADADIAAGRVHTFASVDELVSWLAEEHTKMETDPTELPAEEPATPEVPDGEDAPSEAPQVEPATEEEPEEE